MTCTKSSGHLFAKIMLLNEFAAPEKGLSLFALFVLEAKQTVNTEEWVPFATALKRFGLQECLRRTSW